MKTLSIKAKLFTAIFLSLALFTLSCSDDDTGAGEGGGTTTGDTYWSANGKTYVKSEVASVGKYDPETTAMVIVLASENDSSNEIGSSLNYIFYPKGAGTYKIVSQEELAEDTEQKAMRIHLTILKSTTQSALYESTSNSGTAQVTVDNSGIYHVNISNAVLDNSVSSGTDLPSSVSLKLVNGYVK